MDIKIVGTGKDVPERFGKRYKIKEFYSGLLIAGIFNTITKDKRNYYIVFDKDVDYPTKNCIFSFIKDGNRHCIYENREF